MGLLPIILSSRKYLVQMQFYILELMDPWSLCLENRYNTDPLVKLLQDAEYMRWFRTGFCVGIIALLHLFGQHAGEESLGLALSYCSTDSPRVNPMFTCLVF
jgi:hypothetical protein